MNRDLITVCDSCLQASCWQGEFMCQESQNAGTVDLPRKTLEWLNDRLHLEHPSYWDVKYV